MIIKQERFGDVEVLRLDGKLDVHSAPRLLEILDTLIASNVKSIVLDMGGIDHLSSYGLGVLVSTMKNLHKKDGNLKLVSIRGRVKTLFDMMGLLSRFEIFDNSDDAVKSFPSS
ncbi:MAG: STAS domain-containing protein [Nitrospinota bacterium]